MFSIIKNIILLSIGLIIGIGATGGGLYFLYKNNEAKNNTEIPVIPRQTLDISEEYVRKTQLNQNVQEQALITTLPISTISANYKKELQIVISNVNTIINNNNLSIVPAMQGLSSRLQTGDWKDVFTEIKKVQEIVTQSKTALQSGKNALSQLETENNSTTSDANTKIATQIFVSSTRQFLNTFSEYLTTLDSLLDGTVPTSSKLSELNQRIKILQINTTAMKKDGSSLFLLINKSLQTENSKTEIN